MVVQEEIQSPHTIQSQDVIISVEYLIYVKQVVICINEDQIVSNTKLGMGGEVNNLYDNVEYEHWDEFQQKI